VSLIVFLIAISISKLTKNPKKTPGGGDLPGVSSKTGLLYADPNE